jgi:hypothetical protein
MEKSFIGKVIEYEPMRTLNSDVFIAGRYQVQRLPIAEINAIDYIWEDDIIKPITKKEAVIEAL